MDVKVRSDYLMRQRVQHVSVFLLVIIVLGLIGYGLYRVGRFSINRFFYQNPTFAIHDIDVETDGHLGRDEILRLAGILPGESVFSVDLKLVKRDLELNPLIQHAEVGRELPNAIHVKITERVPMAQIFVQPFGSQRRGRPDPIVFYVDRFGVVMLASAYDANVKTVKPLPALTGVKLKDIRVGKPIQSPQVTAALELLQELELSAVGARLEPEQIDLSRSDSITVLTRRGETILFAPDGISQGLRRLGVIMADAQQNQLALRTADLTVQQNVPATFQLLQNVN